MLDFPRSEVRAHSVPDPAPPNLLVKWGSGRREFLENVSAVLLVRSGPSLRVTALRAPFWSDVFVERPVAWRSMGFSGLYHLFGVIVIYALSAAWAQRPPVRTQSPFDNTTITYYKVSEYLPEINTGEEPTPARQEEKGNPKLAKQRIISVPPAPDNFRQTIVTPSQIKLPNDVSMPNLVAWTPIPSAVPEAAVTRTLSQTKLPAITPDVVAPAPATDNLRSKTATALPVDAVAPIPALDAAKSNTKLPNLPEPSVIAPPPAITGQLGTVNVARLDPTVTEPKLPVPAQRAASDGGGTASGGGQSVAAPPPPNVIGVGDGKQSVGRVIALGLDPVTVNGPINIPNGSRSGQFAATPEGNPNAAGTPDIKGGGAGSGGSRGIANGNGVGAGPPGITVGAPPSQPTSSVAGTPGSASAPKTPPDQRLMASLERSHAADLARRLSPANLDAPGRIEDKVFGSKRYYSMTLNMPNLTSAGGSWIIRFAELDETSVKGDVTAPQAMLKVDPAYPAELMRDHIEGTVTLYAVIHKDGTVGEVRVLRGVEERLDQNAKVALSRWQFRPATKNGSAVDLEAVVQIPFAVRKLPF